MITKKKMPEKTDPDWTLLRQDTIGGSEIGAVLGLNEYESPYSLWAKKTGKLPPFEGNLATEVGTAMEDFVARKFAAISQMNVQRSNYIYFNDEFPNQHALPDRMILQGNGRGRNVKYIAGLECKTCGSYGGRKYKGEDFPASYYAQCVQYMAIMDVQTWYLAVLIGNYDFKIYRLVRGMTTEDAQWTNPAWCHASVAVDEAEIATMARQANEFMMYVRTNQQPPLDGSEATTDAMSMLMVDGDPNAGTLDMSYMAPVFASYKMAVKEEKEAKQRKQEAQNLIRDAMGVYEKGRCGDIKISCTTTTSAGSWDKDGLMRAFPGAINYYKPGKVTRKLTIK